ncbi:MAG: hypothetical protein ABL901_18175 [Hyphomicrobiaceae bacterium]
MNQRAVAWRKTGMSNNKPMESVINPGAMRQPPANIRSIASIIGSKGGSPERAVSMNRLATPTPCSRMTHKPSMKVASMMAKVSQTPIIEPILIKTAISSSGRATSSSNIIKPREGMGHPVRSERHWGVQILILHTSKHDLPPVSVPLGLVMVVGFRQHVP